MNNNVDIDNWKIMKSGLSLRAINKFTYFCENDFLIVTDA